LEFEVRAVIILERQLSRSISLLSWQREK